MAQKGKVLVIDDDGTFCALVEMTLQEEGYQVCRASNGIEGLALIDLQSPDLVLLDLRMPVLDGANFIREFRTRCGRQTPVVVVSAAIKTQALVEAMGAAGWLAKPFDLDELLTTVDRCLGSRERAA